MTQADMSILARRALEAGYAIGAFNAVTIESVEAIVGAAEALGVPVIVQVSQNTVAYHHGLAALGRACVTLAAEARVPVAVHLDHAESIDVCRQAAAIGFGSVMFDGSALSFQENVARTREVVVWAHAAGLSVEGEVGHVAGKEADTTASELTDPVSAATFAQMTGVDALAVAVGTSHHMTATTARLDIDRIRSLRAAIGVPLVLHGSSGVDDDQLRLAVAAGIAKVNVATEMNMAFTRGVRATLAADASVHDLRRYLGAGRDSMREAVERKLAVLCVPVAAT